jgi:hypothetical protein
VTQRSKQLVGGTLLRKESGGEVSLEAHQTRSNSNESIVPLLCLAVAGVLIFLKQFENRDCGNSNTSNCANLPARGPLIGRRLARQDEPADLDGILVTVLEIAAKRREILGRLRKAVKANSVREVLHAAKELCGLYDETSDRVN